MDSLWGLAAVALPMAAAWAAGTLWPNANDLSPAKPILDGCRLTFLGLGFVAGVRSGRTWFLILGPPLGFLIGDLHFEMEVRIDEKVDWAVILAIVLGAGSVLGCVWHLVRRYLQGPVLRLGGVVCAEFMGHGLSAWLKGAFSAEHVPVINVGWLAAGIRHVPTSILLVWLAAGLRTFAPPAPTSDSAPPPISP